MNNLIVLNKNDNVGVSQFIIPEKTKIEGHEISTIDPIPFGHKVCLKTIKKGDPIIKYDQIIGFALDEIKPGQHVHSHNLEFREFKREFKVTDKKHIVDEKADTFFNGILRDNGQVATRNYIGIVSTVNCSATVTKMIVEKIKYSEILKDYPNIDGIVPITHSTGCGMNTESEGMQIFQRSASIADIGGSNGYFAADRYRFSQSGAARFTISQSTDTPNGFGSSMKVDVTTANASPSAGQYVFFQHRIEGQNVQDFAKGSSDAKQYALSFHVKSPKTGTHIIQLEDVQNTRSCSKSYTVNS